MKEQYQVENRTFRTKIDYERALLDQKRIVKLRKQTEGMSITQLQRFRKQTEEQLSVFQTKLGEDYLEELDRLIEKKSAQRDKQVDQIARKSLEKQERRRHLLVMFAGIAAAGLFVCFGVYMYFDRRTMAENKRLAELKGQTESVIKTEEHSSSKSTDNGFKPALDEETEPKEVLEEYKKLLNENKKLIGWLKIDDTNIDYPVVQTTDNEYYQDHNLKQEYDKNGSIFMDKDCDVFKPSTNYILYGHHMKSGNMFGKLDLYASESYCKKHPLIQFDTIYEKGVYQVMYVFRSRVYKEEDVVFKYYQFIDANSEQEFDSYMAEMEAASLYDTGVRASYTDRLLTLSTCDYQEKDGRFVVVAKRLEEK